MGKSRRYKHIDRNAHQSCRSPRAQPLVRTVNGPPVMLPAHSIADGTESFRSRYPAKKSSREAKRARRAENNRPGTAVTPVPAPIVARTPLLLTYQPRTITIVEDDWGELFLGEPANDNHQHWCAQFLDRCDAGWNAAPAPRAATIAIEADTQVPLQRSAAIAPWRRRNPFDIVAVWMRAGWRIVRPPRTRAA